jgi:hypothetical protein
MPSIFIIFPQLPRALDLFYIVLQRFFTNMILLQKRGKVFYLAASNLCIKGYLLKNINLFLLRL